MNVMDGRLARNLIRYLQKGTVKPGTARHFHCGHKKWIDAQLEELSEIEEDGGAVVHFVRGAYGEGKTHFLNYIEDVGRERGWVTAHLECRHDDVELDRFETIYPKIIQKLHLPMKSDDDRDDAVDPAYELLDIWAQKVLKDAGFIKQPVMKPFEVETRLHDLLQLRVMRRNLPGDLQRILCAYPRAELLQDTNAQNDMVAWFKGEQRKINIPLCMLSKPGQRASAPGVDRRLIEAVSIRPVTTATSLDVFRGLLWLIKYCGFKGLLLSIDEVEQIARMRPLIRRERALQTLREFVDNTDGDIGLEYVAIYFAATPNMYDEPNYFRSYDALATRIEAVSQEINWRAPVIDLEKTMLTKSELSQIAKKIRWIYGCGYGHSVCESLSDDQLNDFVGAIDKSRYRIAKPRLLCRSLVDQMERLRQGRSMANVEKLLSDTATDLIRESEQ